MQPIWGITISLFLGCCLWESEANRRFNTLVPMYKGGESLDWGYIHMCRTGFANGFSMKVESSSGGGINGEDSALHGIRLHCSDSGNSIISREGRCGEWTRFLSCNEGHFLKAYRLRTIADNSKMINVQFQCSDGSTLDEIGPQQVGEFTSWSSSCKQGICGLKANVKPRERKFFSSLINMYFQCCDHR